MCFGAAKQWSHVLDDSDEASHLGHTGAVPAEAFPSLLLEIVVITRTRVFSPGAVAPGAREPAWDKQASRYWSFFRPLKMSDDGERNFIVRRTF